MRKVFISFIIFIISIVLISCSNVPDDKLEEYKQVVDQLVFYGGQGILFKGQAKIHIRSGKTFTVKPEFVNDFENDDYNNAYYNVTVLGENE